MTRPIGSLLLLGASGDLAGRLLLPALGQLLDVKRRVARVVLVGAGTEDWDDDDLAGTSADVVRRRQGFR